MAENRRYRRRSHYPGQLSAAVTEATKEAVEEVADRAGWSLAETVRECIDVGPSRGSEAVDHPR